jgi:hypothetical protein
MIINNIIIIVQVLEKYCLVAKYYGTVSMMGEIPHTHTHTHTSHHSTQNQKYPRNIYITANKTHSNRWNTTKQNIRNA